MPAGFFISAPFSPNHKNCSLWVFFSVFRGGRIGPHRKKKEGGMEPYLTVRELAGILRLSEQTVQRYVMNREIPYLKIKKAVRFRPAEIEEWADNGGLKKAAEGGGKAGGGLFGEESCLSGEDGGAAGGAEA
jgi:excisionase family DNA binding protein